MTATVQEMAAEMIVAGGVSHGALEDDALQEYHITVPPGIRAGQRFCARVDTTLSGLSDQVRAIPLASPVA